MFEAIRNDAELTAKGRQGSLVSWPQSEKKINEKSLRANSHFLSLWAPVYILDPKLVKRIPCVKAVLNEVRAHWRGLKEGSFQYPAVAADAKAIKKLVLYLRRLRGRSANQRDEALNSLAASWHSLKCMAQCVLSVLCALQRIPWNEA